VALAGNGGSVAGGIYGEGSGGLELLLAAGAPLPPAAASPPISGPAGQLASFVALRLATDGRLAATVDLAGWSAGAAVITDAADADGDGWGDPVDCDPADSGAFALPPVAHGLQVHSADASTELLSWTDLASLAGSATVHDVLRGSLSSLRWGAPFSSATCAASGISGAATLLASPLPEPGDGTWFLVRGRNGCGTGLTGAGAPRAPLAGLVCGGS
jgi:hypothetical protein